MCGLVGIAGSTLSNKERDIFNEMLIVDSIRGPHSTGVAVLPRDWKEDVRLLKRVGDPFRLMETVHYEKVVTPHGVRMFMGHNRWATVGKINSENAHPFDFDNVVGCHNGTLPHDARRRLDPGSDFGTDSEALYSAINENGVEAVIPEVEGAWALVWYDKLNDTLNMLRNTERPLYYTFDEKKENIFWASEPSILYLCIGRKSTTPKQVYSLNENTLLSWELPNKWGETFKEPERKELKGKERPVVKHGPGFFHGGEQRRHPPVDRRVLGVAEKKEEKGSVIQLPDRSQSVSANSSVSNDVTGHVKKDEGPPNYGVKKAFDGAKYEAERMAQARAWADNKTSVPTTGNVRTFRGYCNEVLSQDEFEERLKDGCSWCSRDIEWGDTVRFINKLQALCDICMDDQDILNLSGAHSRVN